MNFQNIFSKTKIDKLLKHNKYDILINFENGKISFIGPVYDMFRLKLEAMHEYINKNAHKKFYNTFQIIYRSIYYIHKKEI